MVTTVKILGAILMAVCMMSVTRGDSEELDFESVAVDEMNHYRAQVEPAAKDMNKLVYDPQLAEVASRWVSQCVWGHNPSRSNNYPGYVGENMFATTASKSDEELVADAIRSWDSEKSYYNYETNSCRPGKVCGHYTQLVWASTKKVGCAVKKCTRARNLPASFSPVSIVVCNFSPGGNYRGVKPYTKGAFCSGCSTSCDENLCTTQASAMMSMVQTENVQHPATLAIMSVVVFLVASAVAARWWTKTKTHGDLGPVGGDERIPLY